jgi:hypothetical protein
MIEAPAIGGKLLREGRLFGTGRLRGHSGYSSLRIHLRAVWVGGDVFVAIGAVAAVGAAAVTALEVPGGGEDHVWAFPVEVFAFLRRGSWRELWLRVSHDRVLAARVCCLRMQSAIGTG